MMFLFFTANLQHNQGQGHEVEIEMGNLEWRMNHYAPLDASRRPQNLPSIAHPTSMTKANESTNG